MTLGTSEVEALLERARRRERRVILATAACGGGAAALAAILIGALAEARWGATSGEALPGPDAGQLIRWLALFGGAAGLLGAAAWARAGRRRSAGSPAALARKLALAVQQNTAHGRIRRRKPHPAAGQRKRALHPAPVNCVKRYG